jgi:hypothetical protein
MRPERYEPMTLGNMRRNGVRALAVFCGSINCNHRAVLNVDQYPDDVSRFSVDRVSARTPSAASSFGSIAAMTLAVISSCTAKMSVSSRSQRSDHEQPRGLLKAACPRSILPTGGVTGELAARSVPHTTVASFDQAVAVLQQWGVIGGVHPQ